MNKAQMAISKTEDTLNAYGCTFKEYMKDSGRRYDLGLQDSVLTAYGEGIIVGWNRSSNYDIYILSKDEIFNFHPEDVKAKDPA